MYTIDELKKKIYDVHGDKYEYDWGTYNKVSEKMRIICSEHGEFWMSLHEHLSKKQGCPQCGIIKRSQSKTYTYEDFIELAYNKHGNKYQYNIDDYNGYRSKMRMICPIHGEFYQKPTYHINLGYGCPECGLDISKNVKRWTKDEFIKRAKEIHGNKYDYSRVNYININTKVLITCPIHGEFWQTPMNHLNKCGCQKCALEMQIQKQIKGTDKFIEEAKLIHGDKYDYSNVEYHGILSPVSIICPKHGMFKQIASYHLQGNGCPKCANQVSHAEEEIFQYCQKYLGDDNVIQRERSIIKPQELDIYLPTLHAAIEYNGLRWHSEKFGKGRQYHLNKLKECQKNGIQLLQIFEDEYINSRDIVYNKIKHILKLDSNLPKIMGRKCMVKEIKLEEAKDFLTTYHIQGHARSTVYLGAFYDNKLVAVMSFREEYKNSSKWELNRFASNYNYICQGVGGKLFKYFINNYNPLEIKSFADRRWTINEIDNIYLRLGFRFDGYTEPDYHYFKESDGIIRQHKFSFRKNRLHNKYGLPLTMTEGEMVEKLGYTKIYDCGLIKYIWNKKEEDI